MFQTRSILVMLIGIAMLAVGCAGTPTRGTTKVVIDPLTNKVISVENSDMPGVLDGILVGGPSAPTPGQENIRNSRSGLIDSEAKVNSSRAGVNNAVASRIKDPNTDADELYALGDVLLSNGPDGRGEKNGLAVRGGRARGDVNVQIRKERHERCERTNPAYRYIVGC